MRNRKGFTLMELLLVVAVLAIVAAAAAPTFFGGATEAMNEAKRSQFLSAYQNTMSGANIYMSVEAAKGTELANLDFAGKLDTYSPAAARTFNNGTADVTLSAVVNSTNNNSIDVVVNGTSNIVLSNADWNTIKSYK